jgi:hypothetical protein
MFATACCDFNLTVAMTYTIFCFYRLQLHQSEPSTVRLSTRLVLHGFSLEARLALPPVIQKNPQVWACMIRRSRASKQEGPELQQPQARIPPRSARPAVARQR